MISRGGPGGFARCSRQMWTRQMWPRTRSAALSWLDLLDESAGKLNALGVRAPTPFDLEKFLRQLMQLRGGRHIVLTPISVRADSTTVCGYCLKLARWDHVFYTQSRSPLHRTHNAVHELAHLVLGHSSVGPLSPPAPAADRAQPSWLGLADAGYSERCEDEADAAAAILLGRWQETAPRSWVAHSTMRSGSARLADAYA